MVPGSGVTGSEGKRGIWAESKSEEQGYILLLVPVCGDHWFLCPFSVVFPQAAGSTDVALLMPTQVNSSD